MHPHKSACSLTLMMVVSGRLMSKHVTPCRKLFSCDRELLIACHLTNLDTESIFSGPNLHSYAIAKGIQEHIMTVTHNVKAELTAWLVLQQS